MRQFIQNILEYTTHPHHQSLVPTMIWLAMWIPILHSRLSWALLGYITRRVLLRCMELLQEEVQQSFMSNLSCAFMYTCQGTQATYKQSPRWAPPCTWSNPLIKKEYTAVGWHCRKQICSSDPRKMESSPHSITCEAAWPYQCNIWTWNMYLH